MTERYVITVFDREDHPKNTYWTNEPPIISDKLMVVKQEMERYVDLSFIARIEIIDRYRMGIVANV